MEQIRFATEGKRGRWLSVFLLIGILGLEFLYQKQNFVSLLTTLFLIGTLCLAARMGAANASTGALFVSIFYALFGKNTGYLALFCVPVFFAGIFRPLGRIVMATAFLASALGTGIMLAPGLLYEMLSELLFGAFLFLLVPEDLMKKIPYYPASEDVRIMEQKKTQKRRERILGNRLLLQSKRYSELGKAFQSLPYENEMFNQMSKIVSETGKRPVTDKNRKLQIFYGTARAVGQKEFISGDNFTTFQRENGAEEIILSDGMGTGSQAFWDSDQVISRMEQLLESGFSLEISIQMLHRYLISQNREDVGTTMDAGEIQTDTGSTVLYKAGAAATFLLRKEKSRLTENGDGNVYTEYQYHAQTLCAESTPLGILEEMHLKKFQMQLEEGDLLVMMTDGVIDAVSGEKKEERMGSFLEYEMGRIRELETAKIAQVLADDILAFAMEEEENTEKRDDMTVLVAAAARIREEERKRAV